jgi:type IV pilus assembly protein PilE
MLRWKRNGCAARGWTLIELLIAMAVLSLLLTIAVPSYREALRKGRRVDAATALFKIQLDQERYRAAHRHYAEGLTALGWTDDAAATPGGYYRVGLETVADTRTQFRARAVPRPDTDQIHDRCGTLVLDQDGPDLSDPAQAGCWPR